MKARIRRAPRVGFVGKSGSGKTTALQSCVRGWAKSHPGNITFLVWDHTGEWAREGPFSLPEIIVFPSHSHTLEEVCALALETGACTVVADEIDHEVNSHSGLVRGTAIHSVVNYGRHHDVALIWAARRLYDVPRGVTANTGTFFLFSTTEPRDIALLSNLVGSGVAETVKRLPPGRFVRAALA